MMLWTVASSLFLFTLPVSHLLTVFSSAPLLPILSTSGFSTRRNMFCFFQPLNGQPHHNTFFFVYLRPCASCNVLQSSHVRFLPPTWHTHVSRKKIRSKINEVNIFLVSGANSFRRQRKKNSRRRFVTFRCTIGSRRIRRFILMSVCVCVLLMSRVLIYMNVARVNGG